ncbi:hypothetical protein DPX16_23394 [Anabarilius grahami]|uniref:Uncharacterized protein n=1 Tax=Anabarilius grahami TaxID=495550 RepID=A0A3N0Y156_ANAGA|nr:hypothetical protein DPX16_23394 [Anabarilius grahami]
MKDVTSPTLDPELEPTLMPTPELMPENNIALEPESNSVSDQVSEPAIFSVPVGVLVEFKGMDWSPAHTPTAKTELSLASVKLFKDLKAKNSQNLPSPLVPPSSKSPAFPLVPPISKSSSSVIVPPSFPLPPPLASFSPSSSPLLTPLGPLSLQLHLGTWIPCLCLGPPSSSLTSAHRQVGSTWDRRPYGTSGLPQPSGSALVNHHSACETDFRVFSCASSLHPFGSIGLRLLSSSALVLSPTGFTSVLQRPGFTSAVCHHGSVLPCLCVSSALPGSPTLLAPSLAVGHLTLAPPIIGSAMDLCPGCAWGLPQSPPIIFSTLAPPSLHSTVFVIFSIIVQSLQPQYVTRFTSLTTVLYC